MSTGVVALGANLNHTSANTENNSLIKPKRLEPGSVIGLITPATPVADPDSLLKAEETIKYFGWRVKWGKNVGKKSGYFGSPVNERLDDLHAMFRDPEVNGIFAVRGGYGSIHLLDGIDYDLIRKNPKVFLGYSDITAMHLAINKMCNMVTFHGPVTVSSFPSYTQSHLRKAITDVYPIGVISNPVEANKLRPEHRLRTIRPGKATGKLIGGNLSLITALMGTPYEIDTRGAILFIEEVGEQPYRLDRMLTQLRLAGKFQQAAGIIFGECADCGPSDYKPFVQAGFSLGEVLDDILGKLKIPVLSGLTIGHTDDQLTLPVGVNATMDTASGTLEVLSSGVI